MPPAELSGRWQTSVVLKRDLFSTIERGQLRIGQEEMPAVLRRIDEVPWWTFVVARGLFEREKRGLRAAQNVSAAPRLLFSGSKALVRGWIEGTALQIAKPYGDRAYFRSAKRALRELHRAGVCHNDLSKQQNWLQGKDGRAYLTDFQLASCFSRRNRWFRLLAYEDLRHLLKHKHRYVREALTPAECKLLARKSIFARIWLLTGKRLYHRVTRGWLGFTDQEGSGTRISHDAPKIVSCLKQHPHVIDAAVVAFYDLGARHSSYVFVEGSPSLAETSLRTLLARDVPSVPAPQHIQLCRALPRDANGDIHMQALQLIASNQLDDLAHLHGPAQQQQIIDEVVAGRRNLKDRF
ncbi:MAG: serine/threonine protein kinase [Xanthobacteraceae bacterium]